MSAPADLPPAEPGRRPWPWVDPLLRVVGGLVSVVAALVTGLLELGLAAAQGLVLVAVLVTVLANLALGWFARRVTGRRWAMALPAMAWFTLMVVGAGGTGEGDFLLARNNWVGVAMVVVGAMTFAVDAFRLITSPPPTNRPDR